MLTQSDCSALAARLSYGRAIACPSSGGLYHFVPIRAERDDGKVFVDVHVDASVVNGGVVLSAYDAGAEASRAWLRALDTKVCLDAFRHAHDWAELLRLPSPSTAADYDAMQAARFSRSCSGGCRSVVRVTRASALANKRRRRLCLRCTGVWIEACSGRFGLEWCVR
jgi:hypothetical protein